MNRLQTLVILVFVAAIVAHATSSDVPSDTADDNEILSEQLPTDDDSGVQHTDDSKLEDDKSVKSTKIPERAEEGTKSDHQPITQVPGIVVPSVIFVDEDGVLPFSVLLEWPRGEYEKEATALVGKVHRTRTMNPKKQKMSIVSAVEVGMGEDGKPMRNYLNLRRQGNSGRFQRKAQDVEVELGKRVMMEFVIEKPLDESFFCGKLLIQLTDSRSRESQLLKTTMCRTPGKKGSYKSSYNAKNDCEMVRAGLLSRLTQVMTERIVWEVALEKQSAEEYGRWKSDQPFVGSKQYQTIADELDVHTFRYRIVSGLVASQLKKHDLHDKKCSTRATAQLVMDTLLANFEHTGAVIDAWSLLTNAGLDAATEQTELDSNAAQSKRREKLEEAGIGAYLETEDALEDESDVTTTTSASLRRIHSQVPAVSLVEESQRIRSKTKIFGISAVAVVLLPFIAMAAGSVAAYVGLPARIADRVDGRGFDTAILCKYYTNAEFHNVKLGAGGVNAKKIPNGVELMLPAKLGESLETAAQRCVIRASELVPVPPAGHHYQTYRRSWLFNNGVNVFMGGLIRDILNSLETFFGARLLNWLTCDWRPADYLGGPPPAPAGGAGAPLPVPIHRNIYLLPQVANNDPQIAYRDQKVYISPSDTVGNLVKLQTTSYGANKVALVIEQQ